MSTVHSMLMTCLGLTVFAAGCGIESFDPMDPGGKAEVTDHVGPVAATFSLVPGKDPVKVSGSFENNHQTFSYEIHAERAAIYVVEAEEGASENAPSFQLGLQIYGPMDEEGRYGNLPAASTEDDSRSARLDPLLEAGQYLLVVSTEESGGLGGFNLALSAEDSPLCAPDIFETQGKADNNNSCETASRYDSETWDFMGFPPALTVEANFHGPEDTADYFALDLRDPFYANFAQVISILRNYDAPDQRYRISYYRGLESCQADEPLGVAETEENGGSVSHSGTMWEDDGGTYYIRIEPLTAPRMCASQYVLKVF